MPAPLRVVGAAAPSALGDVAARLATLEDVVRRPDMMIVEVVVQDEYTHDVVVAAGTHYLVFDST